eukprot:362761-Chlamydomonas_euryale.AAC.2
MPHSSLYVGASATSSNCSQVATGGNRWQQVAALNMAVAVRAGALEMGRARPCHSARQWNRNW